MVGMHCSSTWIHADADWQEQIDYEQPNIHLMSSQWRYDTDIAFPLLLVGGARHTHAVQTYGQELRIAKLMKERCIRSTCGFRLPMLGFASVKPYAYSVALTTV